MGFKNCLLSGSKVPTSTLNIMGIDFVPLGNTLFFPIEIARSEDDHSRTKQGIHFAICWNTALWKQREGALKQSCVLLSHYVAALCQMASVNEVTARGSCCSSGDIRLFYFSVLLCFHCSTLWIIWEVQISKTLRKAGFRQCDTYLHSNCLFNTVTTIMAPLISAEQPDGYQYTAERIWAPVPDCLNINFCEK